jgi:hypothetical protein
VSALNNFTEGSHAVTSKIQESARTLSPHVLGRARHLFIRLFRCIFPFNASQPDRRQRQNRRILDGIHLLDPAQPLLHCASTHPGLLDGARRRTELTKMSIKG